jgi:IS30 family transposase
VWAERLKKLNASEREQVWLRYDEGASLTELSKRFGMSISTISRIVRDRRQQRNVITVPDEKKAEAPIHSEQWKNSGEAATERSDRKPETVEAGRVGKSRRKATQNATD